MMHFSCFSPSFLCNKQLNDNGFVIKCRCAGIVALLIYNAVQWDSVLYAAIRLYLHYAISLRKVIFFIFANHIEINHNKNTSNTMFII